MNVIVQKTVGFKNLREKGFDSFEFAQLLKILESSILIRSSLTLFQNWKYPH